MVKATPLWQMQLGQIAQAAFNVPLVVWFFTFLYSLIAVLMGWLTGLRASRLFINMGVILGIGVVMIGVFAVAQAISGRATRAGEAPPAWSAIMVIACSLGAAVLMLLALGR